jgi:RimJ/RimL family protein N-acetyltransferase
MLHTPPPACAVPVIETPRLRLRAHTVADFEPYCALWNEPEVFRYTTTKPISPEEVWLRLLRNGGEWAMLGFGSWLAEEKATGELVGEVGIFDRHRDIEPAITVPEIGWILATAKHGKGYATEAASGSSPTRSSASSTRTMRDRFVAAKCGFVEYARTDFRGGPAVLLKRPL